MKYLNSNSWHLPRQIIKHRIDPAALSWLSDNGSLTQRLKNRCHGDFSVQVLEHAWLRPQPSEARLLGSPTSQNILLRQVHLKCGDELCVYARSVIPIKTVQGKHRRLCYLGDKPLGEYLFSSPTLQRHSVEWGQLSPTDKLYTFAMENQPPSTKSIWGRRSLFLIDKKPLLVSEFFLPVLFHDHSAK